MTRPPSDTTIGAVDGVVVTLRIVHGPRRDVRYLVLVGDSTVLTTSGASIEDYGEAHAFARGVLAGLARRGT